MAAKKTSSKAKKPTKAQLSAEEKAQKQRLAIILFAVGILFGFLTFVKGNGLWAGLHNLLFGLLGWSLYFLVPVLIYLAVITTRDKPVDYIHRKIWQAAILILLMASAINIFVGIPKTEGFAYLIRDVYQGGVAKSNGGILGLILGIPLSFLGSPGAQIVTLLTLFVFLMLVTGSTLVGLWTLIRKPVDAIGENLSDYNEKQEAARAEKLIDEESQNLNWNNGGKTNADKDSNIHFKSEPKFNIDVNIGEEELSPEEQIKQSTEDMPAVLDPIVQAFTDTSVDTLLPSERDDFAPITEPKSVEEDFFAGWGVDNPVQFLNLKPEDTGGLPTHDIYRAHPLDRDIEEAGDMDMLSAVNDYLDRIKTHEDYDYPTEEISEPEYTSPPSSLYDPPEIETFKARFDDYEEENLMNADTFEFTVVKPDSADPYYRSYDEVKSYDNVPPPTNIPPAFDMVETGGNITPEIQIISDSTAAITPATVTAEPVATPAVNTPQPKKASSDNPWDSVLTMYSSNLPKETLTDKDVKDKVVYADNGYRLPSLDLLNPIPKANTEDISVELKQNAEKLVATLDSFGVKTKIIDVARGPSVTRYELQPSPGVKISRITGLADDIALNLAAAGIRIEAPIPNKAAVGVEIPNKNISIVGFKELVGSKEFIESDQGISIALGKDITGKNVITDIAKMPHALIAGATGSGKSVCINTIIMSILYKYSPDEVKLIMVDPKVVELGIYNSIPHLLVPVVTDPKKAAGTLAWAVQEMLQRYKIFAENNVRDIKGYNLLVERKDDLEYMPKVVIIIDELADLMMSSPKDVENSIMRLAQMARAAGMHLIIATQRPSVDVITGVIKANIPSRIAFAVSSQIDSRTILDGGGAEKLLGRGDMLFYPVDAAKPVRVQGCFVSDKEVDRVVNYLKSIAKVEYDEEIIDEIDRLAVIDSKTVGSEGGGLDDEDEMIPYAIECIVEAGQASTSMLQRRLKLGYARAARIIDQLEARGIVGPFEGSKPRELLISKNQYLEMKLAGLDQPNAVSTSEE